MRAGRAFSPRGESSPPSGLDSQRNEGHTVLFRKPLKLFSSPPVFTFASSRIFDFWVRSWGSNMGVQMYSLLLLYCLKSTFVAVASAEKASGGNSDGYCGRILGVQTQGTRRDGHHEFRLRMEGDPTTYEPGSTYRGRRWLIQNFLSQAFLNKKTHKPLQINCFTSVQIGFNIFSTEKKAKCYQTRQKEIWVYSDLLADL